MQSRFAWWWWLLLALLLLAPGPAGRLLLDLMGGLTLLFVLLPVVLGGAGWLGWTLLQRRLKTCPACGFRSLGGDVCPACGTLWVEEVVGSTASREAANVSFDARDVTIDVQAQDVDGD